MTGARAPGIPCTSPALDEASVRERFSTLPRPVAFLDGPGGTQCPDIDDLAAKLGARTRAVAFRRFDNAGPSPHVRVHLPGHRAEHVARRLAEAHGIAVWWGDHYAVEILKRLGVDPVDGTVRAGFVHHNTAEEVDRLLQAIQYLLDD